MRLLRSLAIAGALVGLASGALTADAGESAKRSFDIPAGATETTLRAFSEQSGTQFVFSADKVKGVRTNALKGCYSPRDALERLIVGTELNIVQDDQTGALTVDRNRPQPISTDPQTKKKHRNEE